jgi:peptidoglycan/LPS O-acetylase OafA/YrhL
MKQRLTALDGLRGFAALSVMFSHITLHPRSILDTPLFIHLYYMLSAGPNSVQILFVLSGFLMAALYPQIHSVVSYYQKRYARIMPLFVVVVAYLGYFYLHPGQTPWPQHVLVLGSLAIGMQIAGRITLKAHEKGFHLGKAAFFAFIGFQVAVLGTVIALSTKMATQELPQPYQAYLSVLANFALVQPFGEKLYPLSGVFWSLIPEVLFYIVYPFVVIPLLAAGKKWGTWVSILLTLGTLKILFDLDHAFFALLSLYGLQISRASGFMVGVWVGTLYQLKGRTWEKLSEIFSSPVVNAVVLASFLFIQWADWGFKKHNLHSIQNLYYLLSSIVIGLVIIAAINSRTLINRLFSMKWLVLIGTVSYSLYLIHTEIVELIEYEILAWDIPNRFPAWQIGVGTLIAVTVISLLVSAALFKLIESLYFHRSRPTSTAAQRPVAPPTQTTPTPAPWKVALGSLAMAGFFFLVYMGDYSPSLLVSRHQVTTHPPSHLRTTSLLGTPLSFPFTAQYDNLSVIEVGLEYYKDANNTLAARKEPAYLVFKLFDESGKQLFESKRFGYQIEGEPQFPFGFPTIPDSKGKNYRVELSLENALEDDQVLVKKASGNVVGLYTTTKSMTPGYLFQQGMNRLTFVVSHPGFIFAVLFVGAVAVLLVKERKSVVETT